MISSKCVYFTAMIVMYATDHWIAGLTFTGAWLLVNWKLYE